MTQLPARDEQIVRAHTGLIRRIVTASQAPERVPDLEEVLDQAEKNGWVQLVVAIRRILDGARGEDLMHGLDDEDQVVVRAILQGIQNPSSLPDPGAGADPALAAGGLASIIHAAARGQTEALQWAAQMAEQMRQAGGDMARLSAAVRPLINGERDRTVLTRGMGEQGRQLVDGILEELAKLEEQ